jgi:ubiquinone/menaquinone biosynthesis C-methylase UbiE
MADALESATQTMLARAEIGPRAHVLDLACDAGSQTLLAAQRVGSEGHVVASDIAESMLQHVRENARASALATITTLAGAAEDLDLAAETFDAAICRLGLMLFPDPCPSARRSSTRAKA